MNMMEKVRRIVTSHNAAGEAIVMSDESVAVPKLDGFDARSAALWSTALVPADNVSDMDGASKPQGMTLVGGSVFRLTELGPNVTSPMHRTYSIDYVLLLRGQLEAILDGGETVCMAPGDVLVQRGTNHVWRNPSATEGCTFAVCMIEAEPVILAGTILAASEL